MEWQNLDLSQPDSEVGPRLSTEKNIRADCFPASRGTSQLKQWEELLGLILHSCDTSEWLTQGGTSFWNPTPTFLTLLAEISTGRGWCGDAEGWEGLWLGSPSEAVEQSQKTSWRVAVNMLDRWSLPRRSLTKCSIFGRGKKPIDQEKLDQQ